MKLIYLSTARIPDDWAHVIQILKMCEAFASDGTQVELVIPNRIRRYDTDPYEYAGVQKNFTITRLPCLDLIYGHEGKYLYWLRTFSFFLSARALLFFKRYDVLYVREPLALRFFSQATLELHALSPSVRKLVPRLKQQKMIVISEGIKRELVTWGVPEGNVVVAHDAIDWETFSHPQSREAARTRLGLPVDATIACYIGLLDAWKGVGTLYEAAQLLAPDVLTVVIGGDEPKQVEELKMHHLSVRFLGFRPYRELADNMAAADVLVIPNTAKDANASRYTSPLKLFAYMTSGIPIVASDVPALHEVLDDSMAYFVTPDDPSALAATIRKVLTDPAALARAARAREEVKKYTWERRAQLIRSHFS